MKNILQKLNSINDVPLIFTRFCLETVAFYCIIFSSYCSFLFLKDGLLLKEIFMVRASLEYIVASFMLSFSFGLLLDLFYKRK